MKLLIFILILALAGVAYLVMYEEPKVTVPPPPPESTAVSIEIPATPELERKRTIEEIREDVKKKTEVAVPVVVAPAINPVAERKAKRDVFQGKIDSLRTELAALNPQIATVESELRNLRARAASYRSQGNQKTRQWRYVVGGRVNESTMTWHDISTLPPASARNGRTVRYRTVTANPNAASKLPVVENAIAEKSRALAELKNRRMKLESDIANLGLQMNMVQ